MLASSWLVRHATIPRLVLNCSFGALLGKVTPTEILWLVVLETPIYAINAKLADRLGALDVGGSITIHAFGAFYGLAASKVILLDLSAGPET